MSNDWLANKMLVLAKEVERNKNDEFMLLELEDKQIKEKDVVLFKQNKWSESKLDLLNDKFNYRIVLKDVKYDEEVSLNELSNKFLNRVSEDFKSDISLQVKNKGL